MWEDGDAALVEVGDRKGDRDDHPHEEGIGGETSIWRRPPDELGSAC
jgi:hypothetical protein